MSLFAITIIILSILGGFLTLSSILGGFLAQMTDPILFWYLKNAILLIWTFNIFLILFTIYCEAHDGLFSQIPDISMWEMIHPLQHYMILRPYLRTITLITLVGYPTIYFILLQVFDSRMIFVFSVGMLLSMVVSAIAWGWVLSWFVMGWPTPMLNKELNRLNKLD